MVHSILFIASLLVVACAKPQERRAEMTLHEYITKVPAGFVDNGPANPDSILDLRIALVQNNKDGLIEALHNISTPGHPLYGQHLSVEEVAAFNAPAQETVTAVNAWLQAAGLNATANTLAGDWLELNTTVSAANALLDANFSLFTNTETGNQTIRTLNYSIPTDLIGHVQFVHPTISFVAALSPQVATVFARAPNRNGYNPASCDANLVTPQCVQRLHGVPAAMANAPAGSIGVTGFGNQYANNLDLATFLQHYRPDIVAPAAKRFNFQSINDGLNHQILGLAGDEANLDIQYTVGIATGVPTTFYSVGPNSPNKWFEDLVNYFIDQPNVPLVLTSSYNGYEDDYAPNVADRICAGFAALGARGVSVIFSSGNGGVGGPISQDSNNCPDNRFVPSFPASCPYVTVVGATSLRTVAAGVVGLHQDGAAYSGGGFSELFDNNLSPWQVPAVQNYLHSIRPTYEGRFRSVGRAYPDVSAIGTNVAMDSKGESITRSGTSASAPIFASVIALINAERLAAHKNPLGFLNPFLYQNPGAFEDIVQGSNPGCNTQGFPATPGWDPVTGLGTPNFNALKTAALALP
ncbi:hypothetical protein NM688_g3616 [Phlebia brevispora]|uniref:Uncharacterized protein n=1 Tax=Phlebia brevispora TaxID=194682 RepID=A0ACC1T572_9APHY|nr:hypothetical protein NM688_g3616 [Phlebia brevispora]